MHAKSKSCLAILAAGLAFGPCNAAAVTTPEPVPAKPAPVHDTLIGTIKELTPEELLLAREDGFGFVKVFLSPAILVTKDDLPARIEDLAVGQRVELSVKNDPDRTVSINIITKIS